MRRAVGAFRAVGLEAIPATRAQLALAPRRGISTSSQAKRASRKRRAVSHEILGIGYYTMRGWYK